MLPQQAAAALQAQGETGRQQAEALATAARHAQDDAERLAAENAARRAEPVSELVPGSP